MTKNSVTLPLLLEGTVVPFVCLFFNFQQREKLQTLVPVSDECFCGIRAVLLPATMRTFSFLKA